MGEVALTVGTVTDGANVAVGAAGVGGTTVTGVESGPKREREK